MVEAVRKTGAKIVYAPSKRHEFNGIAERAIRTLTETETTMRLHAGIPYGYWPWSLRHATYVRRRLGHKTLDSKPPFELVNGKEPDASELKVFGCLVYFRRDSTVNTEPRYEK